MTEQLDRELAPERDQWKALDPTIQKHLVKIAMQNRYPEENALYMIVVNLNHRADILDSMHHVSELNTPNQES